MQVYAISVKKMQTQFDESNARYYILLAIGDDLYVILSGRGDGRAEWRNGLTNR